MTGRERLYRSFVRLYPRDFRREYGEDLVQHFNDLVSDRGLKSAWARTTVDIVATLPRYQMERLMTEHRATTALHISVALLIAGAVAVMTIDSVIGVPLLVGAIVYTVVQRGALARSLRVVDPGRRSARLRTAAVLGGIFVLTYGTFVLTVGDAWTITDTVLALIGTPAMFGAVGYLMAGLLTPRSASPEPT